MAKGKRGRYIWRLLVAVAALYLYARHVEPTWLQVTRHSVAAPVAVQVKLAHLTDVHTNGCWRKERGVLAALDVERPDLIVLTGDTLHQWGTFEECRPFLDRLKAPLGVFAVAGNWEAACRDRLPAGQTMGAFFASCGVVLLKNEAREIVPGLWLLGLDDYVWGAPDLARATRGVPEEAARVALVHEPGFFDEGVDDRSTGNARYDLLLAGHTHGGQVRIPFIDPADIYLPIGCSCYLSGWYEQPERRMYVSRGIGTSGLGFRFLARPELALFTFTPW
jgi:predicted MPP superfamily phosphohydrolase